jgi:pilus assembly protein Flp/PilA
MAQPGPTEIQFSWLLSNIPVHLKSNRRLRIMKNMKQLLNNLMTDESGQDLIEYALVAALVGLASIASMQSLAGSIMNTFTAIGTAIDSAV